MMVEGQIALVTGARGIGGACAKLLAERGVQVVVTYKQNKDAAEKLITDIQAKDGRAQAMRLDVLDAEQINSVVEHIQQTFGHLDILVSNAAVGWMEKPFEQLAWSEFASVIDSELKAAFLLTKAVLPLMRSQKSGRLIYMSSNLAMHTLQDTIASGTAKAGLLSFMRNIAAEFGPCGITANAIAPGLVITESNQYLPHAAIEAITAYTPLRRIALPEDVAGVVAFLAGEDGRYMTGSTLVVDGGKGLLA
jgi:3-oxoacyl-[acyl-carrier protein] reductase